MADSPVVTKPRIRVPAGSSNLTQDSFANFLSRTGLGTSNPSAGSTYGFNPITRNRQLCEWMYRGSWVVQRAVDAVAEDMVRKGVELKGVQPDENEEIDQQLALLGVWAGMEDTLRWSRLFGGCIAIMLIDRQDPLTPLRIEAIGKDQFKGLMVLDRWVAWPDLNNLVTDFGPDLGLPKFYDVPAGMPGVPAMRVHYSRIIRLEGQRLPYFQRWSENGWGASIIEVLYDRLVAFDSTTQGAAQLVYRAHLRTVKVQKLREIIAAGGPPMEALTAQMEMMRRYQTNEGLTLLDANDDFASFAYSFAGLDTILEHFGDQLCGALRIPRTRLFGESPGGLNSTGDSDMQAYDQDIASEQNTKLRRGINVLLQVAYRSIIGGVPADNFAFKFNPLREMTEKERGEIAAQTTTAVVSAFDAGIVDRARALAELRQSGEVTGVWNTIDDDDIKDAEQDPPLSEVANQEQDQKEQMGEMGGGLMGPGPGPMLGKPGDDKKPGEHPEGPHAPPPGLDGKGSGGGPQKGGVNEPNNPKNLVHLRRGDVKAAVT